MAGRSASDRYRAASIGALVALVALSWLWLLAGAGMGGRLSASLLPLAGGPVPDMAMSGMMPPAPGWPTAHLLAIVAMWWIMMVAMMLPSAAPTILLFDRAVAHGSARLDRTTRSATAWVLSGYVAAWGGFSLLAALLQLLLERSGVVAAMTMAVESRRLAAAILVVTGLYQLSPLKSACLRQCRGPAQFLSRHYRPGRTGAWRLGLLHGAFCVGCCWMLMALLFVGGVMNLAWIGILTAVVAAEKLLPFGRWVPPASAVACLAGAAVLLLRA